MSDTPLPPHSDDAAPIDAEFEPAERQDQTTQSISSGPGWAAFGLVFLLALGGFAHGVWQVSTLSNEREARALGVFKSNIYAGLIVLAGLCLAAFL